MLDLVQGRIEINGFPEDARVVAVMQNFYRQCLGLLLESRTFPPVPEGDVIPDFGERHLITYQTVFQAARTVVGTTFDEQASREAIAIVDEQFGPTGKARDAWNFLKEQLKPVRSFVAEGSERVETPDGKIKFREFI